MGTLSHVLHTGARPICVTEFADALRAISPPRFPVPGNNPSRDVGVAVSGGVDSMALVYLCTQLKRYDPFFQIADNPLSNFRATIIDHRLREGSSEEAQAVAHAVKKIGIPSEASHIQWPESGGELGDYEHIKDLPNFESLARRFRYQKLARICRGASCASLLLAHHEDDQYETVLMRLLKGHGRWGLRGMRAASSIPECEGLHGASQSGYIDDQRRSRPFYNVNVRPARKEFEGLKHELMSSIDHQTLDRELREGIMDGTDFDDFEDFYQPGQSASLDLDGSGIEVEDGGIMIYRPLLEFPKDRLIATCEANGIPWWEDSTNKDPTLTMRNAVRHMCKNYMLPVALQKPFILALSRRCEQEVRAREAEADRLLGETTIHHVEPTVGSASVQFPDYNLSRFPRDEFHPVRRRARILRQREIAGLLIRRIVEIVTPQEQTILLANLQNVISWLFPALSDSVVGQTKAGPPKAFTVAGVHFAPVDTTSLKPSPSSPSNQNIPLQGADKPLVWYLSRTPYPSNQPIPHHRGAFWSSMPSFEQYNEDDSKWPKYWLRWILWDGRFWIRVQHRLPYRAVVQPFKVSDAKAFRESLTPKDRARLNDLLKRYAPGKTRYTLPAIYLEEVLDLVPISSTASRRWYNSGANPNSRDLASDDPTCLGVSKLKLVALPTFGIQIPHLENWLRYKIRYRRIDRSTLKTASSSAYSSFVSLRSLRTGPSKTAAAVTKRRKRMPVRAQRQRSIDRRERRYGDDLIYT
ncbi:hypothetical protein F5Y08DRAFT_136779 [Xylaria arbuscula]|nr:hypothetical protein F5Y08DRAFT_136779 [Xylaria arbuscula]